MTHEGRASTLPEPYALIETDREVLLQSGPCQTVVRDTQRIHRYATQIARRDGGLLTLTHERSSDLDTNQMRYHLMIRGDRDLVLDARIDAGPDSPTSATIVGVGQTGRVVELTGELVDDSWRWWVDGQEAPLLGEGLPSKSGDSASQERLAGIPLDELGLDEQLLADVRDLSYRAVRDAPTCAIAPPVMSTLSGEQFPGCIECVDRCDDHYPACTAEAAAKAASCWVGYFICFAYEMSKCLGKEADCYNACHAAGGSCCPRKCERMGYAECCASGGICCGARCCDEGDICADPSHDLCCPPNSGDACGDHCCDPGFRCASPSRGFCCPRDAGEYCTQVWDEEHWTPRCCPPGQVCADSSIGLCCDEGHGSICGDRCCKRNEVCQNGQCCNPRSLCGYGERAVCCDGECRDGFCCHRPSHWCGEVCCPPFDPCCIVDGRRVCCGAYDECLPGGCCPRELVCGRTCCDRGYRCADPAAEECVPCEGDTVACLTMDYESRELFSICCLPNVDCCNGRCCEPGTMCCAPGGGEPGCYPSHHCVH